MKTYTLYLVIPVPANDRPMSNDLRFEKIDIYRCHAYDQAENFFISNNALQGEEYLITFKK